MKHSLSVTGQEGRTGYNLSISYTDNPGLIKDTGYQRYFLRANVYSDITKWLRIGTRVWGYHTDQKKSDTGSLTNINTQKMIPGVYPYYSISIKIWCAGSERGRSAISQSSVGHGAIGRAYQEHAVLHYFLCQREVSETLLIRC